MQPLGDTLANGLLPKATHDWKRTFCQLETLGITAEAIADDTLLAAYLLDPTRSVYEFSALAMENGGLAASENIPEGWKVVAYRTAEIADFIIQIAPVLRKKLEAQGLAEIYTKMEIPLAPLLHQIEKAGMKIDAAVLHGLSAAFTVEIGKLTTRIHELAGREFNINSPKQVGEILAELNIETGRKTATGKISTSKDVLLELAEKYELPRLIIENRELEKLKSTYTDTLPEKVGTDGRIHGKLNQTVTATGRLSSTDPNLQNIPIRTALGQQIRAAFIPENGCRLLSADYSQLE